MASGVALLGTTLLAGGVSQAQAQAPATAPAAPASAAMPAGYNILFVLVDQEHFFPTWPFPVPGREAIKKKAVTFLNHQAASCVCSSARSVVYTGQHIQHTGIADNLSSIWQRDLSTNIKTIGHRLAELGYHAAYQGKWHLSANLDLNDKPVDAPLLDYRKTLQSYGFQDFFGIGDMIDGTLGGYSYDDGTLSTSISCCARKPRRCAARARTGTSRSTSSIRTTRCISTPTSAPRTSRASAMRSASPAPRTTNSTAQPGTACRCPRAAHQPLGRAGAAEGAPLLPAIHRPAGGRLAGRDRRWRALRNYYFNAIRDCDRKVERLMQALEDNGMAQTPSSSSRRTHGELGGSHQMRGKGTTTYGTEPPAPHDRPSGSRGRQAVPGADLAARPHADESWRSPARTAPPAPVPARDCPARTSRPAARPGSRGREGRATGHSLQLRHAVLHGPLLGTMTIDTRTYRTKPRRSRRRMLAGHPPDFRNRTSIRSIFDGRHRFSRYFSAIAFNTPKTMEELLAKNDLEVYDLQADPDEMTNLALDAKKNGDLILALNQVTNERIAVEVGVDDGSFLPIRTGSGNFHHWTSARPREVRPWERHDIAHSTSSPLRTPQRGSALVLRGRWGQRFLRMREPDVAPGHCRRQCPAAHGPRLARPTSSRKSRQRGLGQRIEMQLKPNDGG